MEYRTAGDLLSDKLRFSLDTVHEQVKLVTASHVPHCDCDKRCKRFWPGDTTQLSVEVPRHFDRREDKGIFVRTADYGVSADYKDCYAIVPANKRFGDTFDVSVHSKRAVELRYGQHQIYCAIEIRERVQACHIENLQIARERWKTSSPHIQPLDAVVNARNAMNSEHLARLEDFSKLWVSVRNKAIGLCVRRHAYTFFWLYENLWKSSMTTFLY